MYLIHLHFERKKPLDVLSTPSGFGGQTFKFVPFFRPIRTIFPAFDLMGEIKRSR